MDAAGNTAASGGGQDGRTERQKRLDRCWKGGVPTRLGYYLAQVLANLLCVFHPDQESPRRVKGYTARLPTTDDEPVVDRPRKFSELQKAFMDVKFRIMRRRGQVESAMGPYASALMLVPYNDRIKKCDLGSISRSVSRPIPISTCLSHHMLSYAKLR